MFACKQYVCLVPEGQTGALDTLELELQTAVSYQVLWRSYRGS